jgi:hypothetical protein
VVTVAKAMERPRGCQTAREAWRGNQVSLITRRLVFIDETATTTNMTRLPGRAPKGQRLIGKTPHGHRRTTTCIAALRGDSVTAPMVVPYKFWPTL